MRPPWGGGDWVLVKLAASIRAPFEESIMHIGIMLIGAWYFFSSGNGAPFWRLKRGEVKL